MLVSVRSAIDDDDVVMISNAGRACRFKPSELKARKNSETGEIEHYLTVRPQGRVTRGVTGMSLSDDENVVGLIVTSDQDTHVVTISKNGFAKRTRLGSGEMRERRDANNEIICAEDGLPEMERDGYRKTNRASKGVKTMNLKDGDQIVRCHQMGDLQDQLFILSSKGMMIRIIAGQAKQTAGRATLGGRVMNLRDVNKKYIDEVIFSARLPAHLVDEEDIPIHLQEIGEEE
jgi:DNA gyrase subunit A